MLVQILFRDNNSSYYNPLNKEIIITHDENDINKSCFDYVLVCTNNACVHIENLLSYLQQEERTHRISPTTDVAIVNSEDRDTFILTQKSSQKITRYKDSDIILQLKAQGTGIIQSETRLSKTHPQLNTIVLCDQTKREQMIRDLENEKGAKHAKIQGIRSLLLQKP